MACVHRVRMAENLIFHQRTFNLIYDINAVLNWFHWIERDFLTLESALRDPSAGSKRLVYVHPWATIIIQYLARSFYHRTLQLRFPAKLQTWLARKKLKNQSKKNPFENLFKVKATLSLLIYGPIRLVWLPEADVGALLSAMLLFYLLTDNWRETNWRWRRVTSNAGDKFIFLGLIGLQIKTGAWCNTF